MKMSFFGFSDSRNSSWAVTRLAIWSSIAPVMKMIRSRSSREKMSKLRSPRLDCSMTMGTSCEAMSWWSITGCGSLLVCCLHRADRGKVQAAASDMRKGGPVSRTALPFRALTLLAALAPLRRWRWWRRRWWRWRRRLSHRRRRRRWRRRQIGRRSLVAGTHLVSDAPVIELPRHVVGGRVEVVDAAGEAARRILVGQVVDAERQHDAMVEDRRRTS